MREEYYVYFIAKSSIKLKCQIVRAILIVTNTYIFKELGSWKKPLIYFVESLIGYYGYRIVAM